MARQRVPPGGLGALGRHREDGPQIGAAICRLLQSCWCFRWAINDFESLHLFNPTDADASFQDPMHKHDTPALHVSFISDRALVRRERGPCGQSVSILTEQRKNHIPRAATTLVYVAIETFYGPD
ncbi:MAG TPA: hypothetical protein VFJ58_00490 [Armatimonadota bacterium]|nr:hypothetical protein [Armatimonadota bacterium]